MYEIQQYSPLFQHFEYQTIGNQTIGTDYRVKN